MESTTIQKITIIFPPGDQLTSLLIQKETANKIEDVLKRLCALRAIDFDLKKLSILNDMGGDVKLDQTVGESGLVFIDIVDKKQAKKAAKEKKGESDEGAPSRGLPKGVTVNPGQCCYLPLEQQLFDDEKKALIDIKASAPELCSNFSDEFVMSCLFARKFDNARALELLQKSLLWRKTYGFLNLPKLSDISEEMFKMQIHVPGSRDKCGRAIRYVNMGNIRPNIGPFTMDNCRKFYTWFAYVGIFCEGMDALRNGLHVVPDMESWGWKNFDLEYQRQISVMWSETFPLLVRKISVLNPPMVFNAFYKIMRTLVKAKIMDRTSVCGKSKELLKLVDARMLWNQKGGELDYPCERWIADLKEFAEKNEERLSAPGRQ